ncbi:probable proteasome subunit beta type-2 isoform X2 [Drosophila grimshawi]|uniref:probable proteasome subunit beta type-2 isoform X2 n=1 Tax=Drosophila grimshawi TaxID=7222 RepID=UPI001C93230D|nr:probable proteasome subunit beta type-2 isoform X2 [Drosophila grimshawi]
MEMATVIGIKGRDCVILAADAMPFVIQDSPSNIQLLSKYCMMGVIGNKSDTLQFSKFIASHIKCYDIQNGYPLNTPAIVHFSCNNVVANLRNRVKHQVALLLGGYDNDTGSLLSSIDAQGSSQTLNYAVYGMGYSVCNRILQKTWKPDLPFDEAHEIIRMCIKEIQKSLIINQNCFHIFVVDKDGVRKLRPLCNSISETL